MSKVSKEKAEDIGYIFYKHAETADRQKMTEALGAGSESSALRQLRSVYDEYPEIISKEDYKEWVERTQKGGDLYKEEDPETKVKIKKLQNKINYWRNQYQSAIDQMAEIENFQETMSQAVSALPPKKVNPTQVDNKKSGKEKAVALFSDLHAGDTISPEETDQMGRYDLDIAARRLEIWAEHIIELINLHRHNYNINELYILDLGDKVSGLIHDELEIAAEVPAAHQFAVVAYLIAQVYINLAKEFDKVVVHSIVGNHGRTKQKKQSKEKWVNFDYYAAQLTDLFCADQPNLEFHSYKAPKKRIEIGDRTGIIQHGSNIRSYMGLPFYGIVRSAKRQLAKQNAFRAQQNRLEKIEKEFNKNVEQISSDDIDFLAMGHFHQLGLLERAWGPIFLNGCFPGPSEYSLQKDIVSRPGQWLMGFHKNEISWRYAVFLDNETESPHSPTWLNLEMPNSWSKGLNDIYS